MTQNLKLLPYGANIERYFTRQFQIGRFGRFGRFSLFFVIEAYELGQFFSYTIHTLSIHHPYTIHIPSI